MIRKRTLNGKKVRKITKIAGGASYAVVLPIEFVRVLGWKERQKVTVKKSGKKLIIEDWEG